MPVVAVLVVAGALSLSTSADAATKFETTTGTVVHVNDGDTLEVDVDADGTGPIRVRLIGVNAFELGECHADEAKTYLADLLEGEHVSLEGKVGQGTDRFGRYRRYISLDGVDVAESLLSAGMVWPVPKGFSIEARDVEYRRLAQAAYSQGVGIWDSDACGHGPHQKNLDIELRVLRNPDGKDSDDPNKEWVKLVNDSGFDVDLSGWGLRSSGFERFTFPEGVVLREGSWLKVHAGSGQDAAKHVYWGLDRPMFSNTHAETVVLVDRHGDVRSWKTTPCWDGCADPIEGKVELRVNYDAEGSDGSNANGEWVDIVNVSDSKVNLVDRVLRNDQHAFVIGGPGTLQPGERMRIHVGVGAKTPLTRFWGKDGGILSNSGDSVRLSSLDDVVIAEMTWPCGECAAGLPNISIDFVNPDAPGSDDKNLDQEFVVLTNRDSEEVSLFDWALKSGGDWYHFGPEVSLAPGDELILTTSRGNDDLTGSTKEIFWGLNDGAHANGRGRVKVYAPNLGLADCFGWGGTGCDPNPKPIDVSITAQPNPPGTDTNNPNGEWVRIDNEADEALDLSGYWIRHHGRTYRIEEGTVLAVNGSLTIYAGSGTATGSTRYWGTPGGILSNSGGTIEVIDGRGRLAFEYGY